MNKNQIVVIVMLVLVCIGLIGYAANLNSQLVNERLKSTVLNKKIADLNRQIADVNAKTNSQVQSNNSLQVSLESANAELAKFRSEADILRAANQDLEAKLNAALNSATVAVSVQPSTAINTEAAK